MIRIILLLLVFTSCALGDVRVVDVSESPREVVQPAELGAARWTTGFWAERTDVCLNTSIPAMWELMRDGKYKPFLGHFLIAAGQAEGDYHGAAWNDGDFYKWLEAACAAEAIEPSAERRLAIDTAVAAIIAAQRADGYLHTPVLIRNRNGDASAKPFADRHDFEVYNMGHLITAGCIHYRVTGQRDLLSAAIKAADFLDAAFTNPTPELARQAVCPSHYMGVIELYRTTREPKYLELAERLLAMRSIATPDGGDDNQDRIPFTQQREAVGHAVRANYLYAGAADLVLEKEEAELTTALDAVWDNVHQKKLAITGGCGALYDGASPDGSEDQTSITRIHQAYGRNYQLPNTTAHNETCAAIGGVLWNYRRYLATGESKYIDAIERAMHNAVLGGVSLTGTEYFYTNPLRVTDPLPNPLRWSRERVPFVVSYCCPPNVVRTIAELPSMAYGTDESGLIVNLYGGSKFRATLPEGELEVEQITSFPWDGKVHFRINECPSTPFTISFRKPAWSRNVFFTRSGYALAYAADPEGYYRVKSPWKAGEELRLDLGLETNLIESHPLVEETRNQLAVQRGPIVYCLESEDLPQGVRVSDVSLPRDAVLKPRFDAKLLGGVTVLEGEFVVRRGGQPWGKSLYRPVDKSPGERIKLKLVPYFAWGNRGRSEMSVWLPAK